MSEQQEFVVVRFWAGHCTSGGHNKKWAAALVKAEREDTSPDAGDQSASALWCYMSVFGRSGEIYKGGDANPSLVVRRDAEKTFEKMVRQKSGAGKDYQEIAGEETGPDGFAEFLPCFGIPLRMPAGSAGSAAAPPAAGGQRTLVQKRATTRLRYTPQAVRHLSLGPLQACMEDAGRYGLSEKVNDLRCPLVFDGDALTAYNRNGELLPTVPKAAEALARLGRPFVIDGGQLTGRRAGPYAIFEVVEWDGEDIQAWPYERRASLIEGALRDAGLMRRGGATLRQALEETLVPGLALLTVSQSPDEARRLLEEVEQARGEGVVVRLLAAPYGGARAAQKYKFRPTIDAIAIGIKRSDKEGSVTLGLVREQDGAVIEIGHVYSGLSSHIAEIGDLLAKGTYIVLEVSFILGRTDYITLVEPASSLSSRRTDKLPAQCTTRQLLDILGEDRAELIARAVPVPGLTFPPTLF